MLSYGEFCTRKKFREYEMLIPRYLFPLETNDGTFQLIQIHNLAAVLTYFVDTGLTSM